MALPTIIKDGTGSNNQATVTSRGQLVVAPIAYSEPYNTTVDVINTAYNLVEPATNQRFVITSILLTANKNVGANDATVELYEATSPTTTTVSKTILQVEMLKQTAKDLTGLNVIVTEGRWVNIKTDDDDVFATVFGYYVSA